jgi:hypothetical protein
MSGCIELTKEMLVSPRRLTVTSNDLTFSTARALADEEALRVSPEPMLLAWFDKKTGAVSPRVE